MAQYPAAARGSALEYLLLQLELGVGWQISTMQIERFVSFSRVLAITASMTGHGPQLPTTAATSVGKVQTRNTQPKNVVDYH